MKAMRAAISQTYQGGQRTSQALYATLLALDAKQKSAAPPDPYRYEQRIDGRRTYLGCTIPDNAPPPTGRHRFLE